LLTKMLTNCDELHALVIAAIATLAMKALAWLRRERLDMNCSFREGGFALREAESSLSRVFD
jgi:hypothetical protein